MDTNDQYTGTLISGLMGIASGVAVNITAPYTTPAQWQAAKQRPSQFGDNKNVPTVKVRQYEPSPEDDMERDRR